jgi:hypothetical protein
MAFIFFKGKLKRGPWGAHLQAPISLGVEFGVVKTHVYVGLCTELRG